MKYLLGLNSEELKDDDIVLSMFDGVGMIRSENLCMNKMQYFTRDYFREYVTGYLSKVAEQFDGKPVWYRTADLVPHQINILDGADEIFTEKQYLIGTRGVRRNLRCQESFLYELSSFVNASKNHKNLGIIIPFVSKVEEMKAVTNILRGKFNYQGKIGMMLETPASILEVEKFDKLGIDNYTIGLNDLTTLTLGADRENSAYCMEDEAVMDLVKFAIDKVHNLGKEITIAGYLNKSVVERCRSLGADNCNIHFDAVPNIFQDVPEPERFDKHYKEIKAKYKKKKEEAENAKKQGNERE